MEHMSSGRNFEEAASRQNEFTPTTLSGKKTSRDNGLSSSSSPSPSPRAALLSNLRKPSPNIGGGKNSRFDSNQTYSRNWRGSMMGSSYNRNHGGTDSPSQYWTESDPNAVYASLQAQHQDIYATSLLIAQQQCQIQTALMQQQQAGYNVGQYLQDPVTGQQFYYSPDQYQTVVYDDLYNQDLASSLPEPHTQDYKNEFRRHSSNKTKSARKSPSNDSQVKNYQMPKPTLNANQNPMRQPIGPPPLDILRKDLNNVLNFAWFKRDRSI